jgi:putative salt-induced outer membrane protein YdiY
MLNRSPLALCARCLLLAAAAIAGGSLAARADTVGLANGDKITGTVTAVTTDHVDITTPYAGKLSLDRKQVKTIYTAEAVPVTHPDNTVSTKFISPLADGSGWTETDTVVPAPQAVVPPPVVPVTAEAPTEKKRFTKYLYLGPDWKNQFAVGATEIGGNTDETDVTAGLTFNYLKAPNELTIKFLAQYGKSNGVITSDLFDQGITYRRDLSSRWYLFGNEDARYDGLKGLSLDLSASVGPGYYLIKNDRMKLDVRVGPGYIYEKRFDGTSDSNVAGVAGLRFQYKINDRFDVSHTDDYTTSLQDDRVFTIDSETALNYKLDIESGFGLKLAFSDLYDNTASLGHKNNDTRLVLALTLDF